MSFAIKALIHALAHLFTRIGTASLSLLGYFTLCHILFTRQQKIQKFSPAKGNYLWQNSLYFLCVFLHSMYNGINFNSLSLYLCKQADGTLWPTSFGNSQLCTKNRWKIHLRKLRIDLEAMERQEMWTTLTICPRCKERSLMNHSLHAKTKQSNTMMLLRWPFEGLHIEVCLIHKTSTSDHDRKRNKPFTTTKVYQWCYLGLEKRILTSGENKFTGNTPTRWN